MDDHYDPDLWDVAYKDFAAVHDLEIQNPYFTGPPPGHPHVILRGDIVEKKVCLHICPACGWWIAEDRAVLPAMYWQHWAVTLASAPVLEELALDDIDLPLQQVRRYLMRKFEARASMHPRLFELTVASVFGDLGYQAYATAYSNDGGVDVILEDGSGARVGVQVKRRRDAVNVEQIRAFLGALMLGGYTRGAYVSASRFRRGAREAAQRSTQAVMPIELVDANRFFDMLGYAQLKHRPGPEDCNITRARPLTFHGHDYYHLNTL
ncbi:restriction endonuclease [Variovorax boronicumulans]|uniref:restriction endonuclease n=1 Tax=Variovorax boronicumulans TaxID=436515 RepID=UPI0036F2C960